MPNINIKLKNEAQAGWIFDVEIGESGDQTRHEVAVDKKDYERLGGNRQPEELVKKSFEFLLKRESKESILRKFNLMEIQKYFSEYETEIKK